MKVGIRKPSIKKSISARTTGRINRAAKKAVNPFYGKKGMGLINDPERAVKNAIYKRTTIGVSDIVRESSSKPARFTGGTRKLFLVISAVLVFVWLFLSIFTAPAFIVAILFFVFFIYLLRQPADDLLHKKGPSHCTAAGRGHR